MYRRDQVFVRAVSPKGVSHVCDVLDLDEESFRAFVVNALLRGCLVTGLRDAPGPDLRFRSRGEPTGEDDAN
jgi:hypothetical protein